METQAFFPWAFSSLLLSLRIAPALVFAPPFSLIRIPATFRALLAVSLAAAMAGAWPGNARIADLSAGALTLTAMREFFLGLIVVLTLQIPFAALQMAGRTIDVQAGFGLAAVIDPATGQRSPLVGTLFNFAAGLVFFGLNGHLQLMRIAGASLEAIPLGQAGMMPNLDRLTGFIGISFLSAFGMGGLVILAIFLSDMTVAMMSRTVPQMNVLILGFQVKNLILLAVLPVSLGLSAAVLARLVAYTLDTLPRLL